MFESLPTLPVILIVTGHGCAPCKKMRGESGMLINSTVSMESTIPGGNTWSVEFFDKLLTGGMRDNTQRFRIYEIHKEFSNPNIRELNEFRIINGKVARFSASQNSKGSLDIKKYMNSETLHSKISDGEMSDLVEDSSSFINYVNSKVPADVLVDILRYLPMFMFFDGDVWNNALHKRLNAYCYVSEKFKLVERGTRYGMPRYVGEFDPHNSVHEDPVLLAGKFKKGGVEHHRLSEPPVDLKVVEESTSKDSKSDKGDKDIKESKSDKSDKSGGGKVCLRKRVRLVGVGKKY